MKEVVAASTRPVSAMAAATLPTTTASGDPSAGFPKTACNASPTGNAAQKMTPGICIGIMYSRPSSTSGISVQCQARQALYSPIAPNTMKMASVVVSLTSVDPEKVGDFAGRGPTPRAHYGCSDRTCDDRAGARLDAQKSRTGTADDASACDYFKMRHRWRVQATWTYDDEPKSYSPIFTRTRTGAARQRRNIERTLWHFPTLDVKVERVSLQAAKVEMDRRAAALLDWVSEPVHLVSDMTAPTTACGRNVERVDNRSVPEVFAVSSRRCPDCATAESSRVQ